MDRIIPSMENRLLFFLNDNDKTPEQYIDSMVNLEKKIEKDMIEVFNKIGVHAIVKTDRYSLPYQHEIKTTQHGESYLNGAFESIKLYREVLKEMIENDLRKIRFYILAEVEDHFPMGKVNYYFRYYEHY
jgi:hypothetical protein